MRTLLLVEDEVLVADMILRGLAKSSVIAEVLHATDVPEALRILAGRSVDLVLLDINLGPGRTGFELAEEINATSAIPILFLTAQADQATLQRVKALGAVGYLNKPVNGPTLLTTVELALQNSRANHADQLSLQVGTGRLLFRRDDLLMARADHVYVELQLLGRTETLRISLTELLNTLPPGSLVRVNRSEAVNPAQVVKVTRTEVHLRSGEVLRLTASYRDAFA